MKWYDLADQKLLLSNSKTIRKKYWLINTDQDTIPRRKTKLGISDWINHRKAIPFPKRQNLDSSNLKEFADDKFEFDENGRRYSKRVENSAGKGEIGRYEHFLLFPQYFQNIYTAET